MAEKPTRENQYFVDKDGNFYRSRGSGLQVGELRVTNESVPVEERKTFGHKLDDLDWSSMIEVNSTYYRDVRAASAMYSWEDTQERAREIYQEKATSQ